MPVGAGSVKRAAKNAVKEPKAGIKAAEGAAAEKTKEETKKTTAKKAGAKPTSSKKTVPQIKADSQTEPENRTKEEEYVSGIKCELPVHLL